MSDRVASFHGLCCESRALPRLALASFALAWLAGCSADVKRFSEGGSPFANPFGQQTSSATPAATPATQGVASAPAPAVAAAKPQPVGGSAAGWTAVGGSAIVVAQGETLDSISQRYGVPAAALLSANGLKGASEVKSGMKIVVPVYNAGDGKAVAAAKPAKARSQEVAANEAQDIKAKAKKAKAEEKTAEATKREEKTADKSKAGDKANAAEKSAGATKPAAVAQADAKPAGKKPAVDDSPTGDVESKGADAKPAAQADAASATPEFRWPARGRIIEGFKAGGNDGINISVPAGTSVRAAENGVVVYAGDGLKGYGNLVLIKHPNGFVTAYANNAEITVKRGDTVKRGQIIAKSGDTGNVNAPQLHFELRKGATPVDPTQYLAGL